MRPDPDPDPDDRQQELVHALATTWRHAGLDVQLLETHISRIILAGPFAYKFKKRVRFSFLDFSELSKRRFYCDEECRLGRRLAPDLYLGVTAITGSSRAPVLDGDGAAIEFAVRMQRFSQDALWAVRIEQGRLSRWEIDALAERLARFHREAQTAPSDAPWGSSETMFAVADSTVEEVGALLEGNAARDRLDAVRQWEAGKRSSLARELERRKRHGAVRECHGDLHCANILTVDTRVEAFDFIEFNDALRWIDVMNDIAFTTMDLTFHGQQALASRLLSKYLEHTGDYDGLAAFLYYRVQRALVRCKVTLLAAAQQAGAEKAARTATALRYLDVAWAGTRPALRALVITHGFSGSGKSTFAYEFVERSGAIMLRSDVERKRLAGRDALQRTASPDSDPMYREDATERTYERLREIARSILTEAGLPVIVDATFLRYAQRSMFFALAKEIDVPFLIVDLRADEDSLRQRLAKRARENRDPSDADERVLSLQLQTVEPFRIDELRSVHTLAMDECMNPSQLSAGCDRVIQRLTSV